ncbi:MAG: SDR family oxidoreductase [Hyphomicrobiales bacterium]
MGELSGKTAVITGASRGIGAAAARELAIQGVSVVLAARTKAQVDQIADEIRNDGGAAEAISCDVTSYEDVTAAINICLSSFGKLDILVNNAGAIEPIARLGDSDPEDWVRSAAINYKGVYYGLRAALPVMEKQGSGTIVNISSGAAVSALEGWSHYCSAKAGALMLTKCTHNEYADKGICVVGLSPGTVATDMQVKIKASGVNPVSQLDTSDHIPAEWPARAIAWLCTAAAAEYAGGDFRLSTDEARRKVGLIE